jgi:hypothetical protein
MAKIQEEILVIKLSKLIKDSSVEQLDIIEDSVQQTLEQAIQELVGDSVIVEVERA